MNQSLAGMVVQKMVACGVLDVCICPAGQNAPFIPIIKSLPELNTYYWFEERSAAFFALGKSRETRRPVAIITTSGTAVAELLPATIEAYYSGTPLLLITADRPRRFRGSGAPQSIEQKGLFEPYISWSQDIEYEETCALELWTKQMPAHLNVCLETPEGNHRHDAREAALPPIEERYHLQVVVGGLAPEEKENVIRQLIRLGAPVYPEALSGLREEPAIRHLVTPYVDRIWTMTSSCNYMITNILRIGNVPVARFWRDLESEKKHVKVHSYTTLPFSGLGRPSEMLNDLEGWVDDALQRYSPSDAKEWITLSQCSGSKLIDICAEYPDSEPAMMHDLSNLIPEDSFVYLGNSMPIREWDMVAARDKKSWKMAANRGANGIDGQLSTFFGMCRKNRQNWALLGDLTTLYDMAAPWITGHLKGMDITIVVINNYGGKIFERMFSDIEIQNCHDIQFESFARFWGIEYEQWCHIPKNDTFRGIRLIELLPDPEQTRLFWDGIDESLCSSRFFRETHRLESSFV